MVGSFPRMVACAICISILRLLDALSDDRWLQVIESRVCPLEHNKLWRRRTAGSSPSALHLVAVLQAAAGDAFLQGLQSRLHTRGKPLPDRLLFPLAAAGAAQDVRLFSLGESRPALPAHRDAPESSCPAATRLQTASSGGAGCLPGTVHPVCESPPDSPRSVVTSARLPSNVSSLNKKIPRDWRSTRSPSVHSPGGDRAVIPGSSGSCSPPLLPRRY